MNIKKHLNNRLSFLPRCPHLFFVPSFFRSFFVAAAAGLSSPPSSLQTDVFSILFITYLPSQEGRTSTHTHTHTFVWAVAAYVNVTNNDTETKIIYRTCARAHCPLLYLSPAAMTMDLVLGADAPSFGHDHLHVGNLVDQHAQHRFLVCLEVRALFLWRGQEGGGMVSERLRRRRAADMINAS